MSVQKVNRHGKSLSRKWRDAQRNSAPTSVGEPPLHHPRLFFVALRRGHEILTISPVGTGRAAAFKFKKEGFIGVIFQRTAQKSAIANFKYAIKTGGNESDFFVIEGLVPFNCFLPFTLEIEKTVEIFDGREKTKTDDINPWHNTYHVTGICQIPFPTLGIR